MIRPASPTPGDLCRAAFEHERAGRWIVAAALRAEAAELETVKPVTLRPERRAYDAGN